MLVLSSLCSIVEAADPRTGPTKHILSHYNASTTPSSSPTLRRESLADHTFFFQPHLAWHWIAQARVDLVDADTGFASFGPYMRSNCGNDSRGNGVFPVRPLVFMEWEKELMREEQVVKELYNIFAGTLCPPTDQLVSSAPFSFLKDEGLTLG